MVECRHLPERLHIGDFAGENVVARNWFERFCSESQIHLMARLGGEIDNETGENSVNSGDFPEAPAFVGAKAAFRERNQRVKVLRLKFSSGNQLFELFSHKNITLNSRVHL